MSNACQGCGIRTVSSLVCPTCSQLDRSCFFCSQECFAKNWDIHQKLHGILQHQQKIQAELESKSGLSTSGPSIGSLREKMYRPPQDEETGAIVHDAVKGDSQNRPSSQHRAPSYGNPSLLSRIAYAFKRRRWSQRKRCITAIASLVVFTFFVHFGLHTFSVTAAGEPEMLEIDAEIIEAEAAPQQVTLSMDDLQRQITTLKEQQAKHDQQISYIMTRFVEKVDNLGDVAGENQSALPQDLVASSNREETIAEPYGHHENLDDVQLQGIDRGAVVRAGQGPLGSVLRPRVQDMLGDLKDQNI